MKPFSRLLVNPVIAAALVMSVVAATSSASDLAPSAVVEPTAHGGNAAHAQLLRFLLEPVADPAQFEGKRIAIVASDGASAFELETTRDYFMDRGARVHILTPRPVDGAPIVGLAGFVPPHELVSTLDYAGERRLVAVTWYLDQVRAQDYDAVYVPNYLTDLEGLRTNGQAMRFLLAAQGTRRPVFVTGNAWTVLPGLEAQGAAQADGVAVLAPTTQMPQWDVTIGEDAFDMPRLIGVLSTTLAAAPNATVN